MSETPTPIMDKIERDIDLSWFGVRDNQGRALDKAARFREKGRELERELAEKTGLVECRADAERYRYLRNHNRKDRNYGVIDGLPYDGIDLDTMIDRKRKGLSST